MTIIINKDSFGGHASKKWDRIKHFIFELYPAAKVRFLYSDELNEFIRLKLDDVEPIIIAGGDGTFHFFIQEVMRFRKINSQNSHPSIGFIGLGSSNSFLKSCPEAKTFKRIPYLIQVTTPLEIDIGEVIYEDGHRYFLANGSFGLLALGNNFFNCPGPLTAVAKKISTTIANLLVFLKLLVKYRPVSLSIEGETRRFLNVQFLKSRYYTGGYHFPSENKIDSGRLDWRLTGWVSRIGTLKSFLYLSCGQPEKLDKHQYFTKKGLVVRSKDITLLELDGEILKGRSFEISCIKKALPIGIQI